MPREASTFGTDYDFEEEYPQGFDIEECGECEGSGTVMREYGMLEDVCDQCDGKGWYDVS